MIRVVLVSILLAGVLPFTGWSHGDLHDQIAAVTRELQQRPGSADLHIKRGELLRAHEDWDAALADFDQAGRLDPALALVWLVRGRTLFEAGRYEPARRELSRFIERHPAHAEALMLRGRTLARLKDPAAANDYSAAIAASPEPAVDLYFERARALKACGAERWPEALRGLEEGLARIGPVITLELPALDLEIALARYDAALGRIDRLAAQSPRPERWWLRRGDVLLAAGRRDEARASFEKARAATAALPDHLRRTQAVREMEAGLNERLRSVSARDDRKRDPAL